jgi:hypothetical protein
MPQVTKIDNHMKCFDQNLTTADHGLERKQIELGVWEKAQIEIEYELNWF